jgi:integrase
MAILAFCSGCKRYVSRKLSNCPNCGSKIGTTKKFQVNLPTPAGKRITQVVKGNISLAERVEAKIKVDIIKERNFGIRKSPLIHDIFRAYKKWTDQNRKGPHMLSSRWEVHIEPYIPELWTMDKLTSSDINQILDRMRDSGGRNGNGCAPATIKHVLGLIKRLYNWANENGLYKGPNPAVKIKPPRLDNCVTNYLSKVKLIRLRHTLKNWPNQGASLVVFFALYTGCRKSEIFKLEWKDIDLQNNFFSLRNPKGRSTKLPLNKKALEVLEKAQKLNNKAKWVFPNRFGKRRKHFGSTWDRIKEQARLPKEFRFHDLRHTYATYLASSGKVDLYTLQKLLNHQSPAMTQRYAHLLDKSLQRGAAMVDEIEEF